MPQIDEILDGGIEEGFITEIYGEAGSGKTHICMSMMINCLLSNQKVIYISTSKQLQIERFFVLLRFRLGKRSKEKMPLLMQNCIIEHITNSKSFEEYLHLQVQRIPCKLLIIDNIASYCTEAQVTMNQMEANAHFKHLSNQLRFVAKHFQMAILVVNNVVASINHQRMVAALGPKWTEVIDERYLISRSGTERQLSIELSHRLAPDSVMFQIQEQGLIPNPQRVAFVGDPEVGKSSIIRYLQGEEFTEEYYPTEEIIEHKINIGGNNIVTVLDTSGNSDDRRALIEALRGVSIVFICFDVSNQDSFVTSMHLLDDIKKQIKTECVVHFVACKIDLERQVPQEQVTSLLNQYPTIDYMEVSVMNSIGLDLIIDGLPSIIKEEPKTQRSQVTQQSQKSLKQQPSVASIQQQQEQYKCYDFLFPNGRIAKLIKISNECKEPPIADMIFKLQIPQSPVINLIGAKETNRGKFYAGIARAAYNTDALIVDGAISTGIEKYAIRRSLKLIGVAQEEQIKYPSQQHDFIEPNEISNAHTHVFLTQNPAEFKVRLCRKLREGKLLKNGARDQLKIVHILFGETDNFMAELNAVVSEDEPIIVVKGSAICDEYFELSNNPKAVYSEPGIDILYQGFASAVKKGKFFGLSSLDSEDIAQYVHFLLTIKSFFDDQPSIVFWDSSTKNFSDSDMEDKHLLFHKSQKTGFWVSRTYGIFGNRLVKFKGRDLTNQFIDLHVSRIELIKYKNSSEKESEHKKKYGFRVSRNGNYRELYAQSKEATSKWFDKMKVKSIQVNFKDEYSLQKIIGKGNFAKVHLAVKKDSKQQYAVKAFEKKTLIQGEVDRLALIKEIKILRQLNHKGTIRLYGVYEDEQFIYLIQDYLDGGELMLYMKKNNKFTEQLVARMIATLLSSVDYLHRLNILHRDLKPENMILRNKGALEDIVITDFGLADYFDPQCKYMFQRCGTPGFVAPEVLQDRYYDHKVDVFSIGCLMFFLVAQSQPFKGATYDDVVMKNYHGKIEYTYIEDKISPSGLSLLKQLLSVKQSSRVTCQEALRHEWFRSHLEHRQIVSLNLLELMEEQSQNPKQTSLQFDDMNVKITLVKQVKEQAHDSKGSLDSHDQTDIPNDEETPQSFKLPQYQIVGRLKISLDSRTSSVFASPFIDRTPLQGSHAQSITSMQNDVPETSSIKLNNASKVLANLKGFEK